MTFAKYAFPEGVWEQLKKTIQDQDQYTQCAVVELGHLCKRFDDEFGFLFVDFCGCMPIAVLLQRLLGL
jgi:hypothetical protein